MGKGSVTFKYRTDNNTFQLTVKKINELPVKRATVNLFKRLACEKSDKEVSDETVNRRGDSI